jgi:class 3 adenylate cyclase/tetratricopeptide (TPR) repeat protein
MKCPQCQEAVQVGHRFCPSCGARLAESAATAPGSTAKDTAEHRQISLVFTDIVQSASLITALGAEAYRELLRAYREIASQVVAKYKGRVASFVGDGMMICFGFPVAREDDPVRAVQASLELQERVAALNLGHRLGAGRDGFQIRIGVHTGVVIAGDIRSETAVEPMATVGEASNIAARLQSEATPGSIIISQDTYELVGNHFDCRFLGAPSLKGIGREVRIFEVHSPAAGDGLGRGPARGRLVGREREIQVLLGQWERALAGRSAFAVVTGEAGVGKSRLLRELVAALEEQKFLSVLLKCSSIHDQTPLHPIIEFLNESLGLAGLAASEKWDRLVGALRLRFGDSAESVAVLSNILSVPLPEGTIRTVMSPQELKTRFHGLVAEWLARDAEAQPVLLMVEDVHWADPSTVELLTAILPQLADARVCTVATCREEADRAWLEPLDPHVLVVTPLDKTHSRDLVRELAAGRNLTSEIEDVLSNITDGIPLFIEEMTRSVLESGFLANANGDIDPIRLPSTLQQTLNARIDRAGANREILHLCASMGREVDEHVLSAIWDGDPDLLAAELKKLSEAGILLIAGPPMRRKWMFRHALIQEEVYGLALSAHRRSAHARIAAALRDKLPEVVEQNPQIVAHHYLAARQEEKAFPYLQRAAEKASERSAHREALHYLNAAIRIVQDDTPSIPNKARELQLVLQAGVVQTAMSAYSAPEVGQRFERALELSRGLDESTALFPALHGLYRFYYVRADVERASGLCERLLSIAHASGSPDLLLEAHRAEGNCWFAAGQFSRADAHFKESFSLYDEARHADHRFRFGVDPYVGAAAVGGLNAIMLGRAEDAFELGTRAIETAEARQHPFSLCWALIYTSLVRQIQNDVSGLGVLTQRLVEVAALHRLTQWQIGGSIMRGWWLFCSGADREGGLEMLTTGIVGWRAMGALNSDPYFSSLLAEAHLTCGDCEAAAGVSARALETARSTGEVWWMPELLRLHGRAIRMRGRSEDAEVARSLIDEARGLAQTQGSQRPERMPTG